MLCLRPLVAMKRSRRSSLTLARSCSCALALLLLQGPGLDAARSLATANPESEKKQKQNLALKGLPITELSADEAVLHALNRLAYGPRPGDTERAKQIGLAKWIDRQLNPNAADDKALEARLQSLPTLGMSAATLIADYARPKQAARKPAPSRASASVDPAAETLQAPARNVSASGENEIGRASCRERGEVALETVV